MVVIIKTWERFATAGLFKRLIRLQRVVITPSGGVSFIKSSSTRSPAQSFVLFFLRAPRMVQRTFPNSVLTIKKDFCSSMILPETGIFGYVLLLLFVLL